MRIAGGWAADRSDHPKWVAFVGYGLSCVTRFGLLFATGLGAVTAVVTADRIGKGIRTAPRDAMIAASVPTSDLARAFGVHRTLDTIGAVLGPLVAFAILQAIPDGYTTVMVASLAFAVIGVALIGLLVPDARPRHEAPDRRRPRPSSGPRSRIRDSLRLLVVVGVLGILTVGDGFLYLALLERSGFADEWFPMLYVGTNIVFLRPRRPGGPAGRPHRPGPGARARPRRTARRLRLRGHPRQRLAGACRVPCCCSVPSTPPPTASSPPSPVAWSRRGVRASGIATAQTVMALARLVSSLGFGVLWFAVGPQSALVLVGVLLALAIPVALREILVLDRTAEAV